MVPPDCDFFRSPRTTGRGGGLASVFTRKFACKHLKSNTFTSFEVLLMQIQVRTPVLCVVVYWPPKTNKNFIAEFTEFLGGLMLKYDRLLILIFTSAAQPRHCQETFLILLIHIILCSM